MANDMKKGQEVVLRGTNWRATIEDNKKGLTRLATVYGLYTEMGSIYVHDIAYAVMPDGRREFVEFTPAQQKKVNAIKAAGF